MLILNEIFNALNTNLLQGGSASDVGLTAFVLIALTENANLTGVSKIRTVCILRHIAYTQLNDRSFINKSHPEIHALS